MPYLGGGTHNHSGTYLPLTGGTLSGDLEISKDNPILLLIDNGAGGTIWKIKNGVEGNGKLSFTDNDTARVTFVNDGKVGISNTSPGALLEIGTAGTTLGTFRLSGNTSGYVQLQTAAEAGSWTLTLPPNDGDNGQVLTTNGSGVTTWTTPGGGGQSPYDAIVDADGGADYTTLGAAITAGKLNIYIRKGTTAEAGTITLGTGVSITGSGIDETVIGMGGARYINIAGDNVSIKYLTVQGSSSGSGPISISSGTNIEVNYVRMVKETSGNNRGLNLLGGTNVNVTNCLVEGKVYFAAGTKVNFADNTITAGAWNIFDGIADGAKEYVIIARNYISGSFRSFWDDGGSQQQVHKIQILNNYINNTGGGSYRFVRVTYGKYLRVMGNVVISSTFADMVYIGADDVSDVVITDNNFDGATDGLELATSGITGVVYANNVCTNVTNIINNSGSATTRIVNEHNI